MPRLATWVFVLTVAGLAGYLAGSRAPSGHAVPAPPTPTSGGRILLQDLVITLFADMAPLPRFALDGTGGEVVDNARLHGRFTLIAFGESGCREGCPANRAAMQRLLEALPDGRWQAVFVALDGRADAVADRRFVTVTGPRAQIQRLAGALRAPADGAHHDHRLWLVDPDGRWFGLLETPLDEARALDRLQLAAQLHARGAARN